MTRVFPPVSRNRPAGQRSDYRPDARWGADSAHAAVVQYCSGFGTRNWGSFRWKQPSEGQVSSSEQRELLQRSLRPTAEVCCFSTYAQLDDLLGSNSAKFLFYLFIFFWERIPLKFFILFSKLLQYGVGSLGLFGITEPEPWSVDTWRPVRSVLKSCKRNNEVAAQNKAERLSR